MKNILSILFFLISFAALSQGQKREFEKKIDKAEMPNSALLLYHSEKPEKTRRERFYLEKDGSEKSYEIKLKYNKHRYSIEYNEDGILEDIEVKIKGKDVSETSFQKIKKQLEKKYDRHKIEKVQAQFVHDKNPGEVFQSAFNMDPPDNYEFIVITKNNGQRQRYELLFDQNGNLLQKREVLRESDYFLLF